MKRMGDAGAQSGQRGFERVARERVGVLAGAEPVAQTHDRDAVNRRHQDPEHRVRFGVRRAAVPASITLWMCAGESSFHLADETEPLPVAG